MSARAGPSSVQGPPGSYLYAINLGRGAWSVAYMGEQIGTVTRKRDGSWTMAPHRTSSLGDAASCTQLQIAIGLIVAEVGP